MRDVSALLLFQEQRKCEKKSFTLEGNNAFFKSKHWDFSHRPVWEKFVSIDFLNVYEWPHCLHYVEAFTQLRPAVFVPYSVFYSPCEQNFLCLFTGRCLSLYLLTHSGTGSFWKSAMVTGSLTRAKLRLTTQSQMYRAPCWTAAKWLCLSLWGNSLLTLMLTVVVGYWGLALLLGLGGKRGLAWDGLRLGAGVGNVFRQGDEMLMEPCLMPMHLHSSSLTDDYSMLYMCANDCICVLMWLCTNTLVRARSSWQNRVY